VTTTTILLLNSALPLSSQFSQQTKIQDGKFVAQLIYEQFTAGDIADTITPIVSISAERRRYGYRGINDAPHR
jgi:hypothetical protein